MVMRGMVYRTHLWFCRGWFVGPIYDDFGGWFIAPIYGDAGEGL